MEARPGISAIAAVVVLIIVVASAGAYFLLGMRASSSQTPLGPPATTSSTSSFASPTTSTTVSAQTSSSSFTVTSTSSTTSTFATTTASVASSTTYFTSLTTSSPSTAAPCATVVKPGEKINGSLVKVLMNGPPPPSQPNLPSIQYNPQFITVVIGINNTVQWINDDTEAHTVTANNHCFNSGNMDPNVTFTLVFNVPGTYSYYCAYHYLMKGSVTVKG